MFEKCCCRVRFWRKLIKLVGASCFYTCLKNPTFLLYLLIGVLTYLIWGEVGFR